MSQDAPAANSLPQALVLENGKDNPDKDKAVALAKPEFLIVTVLVLVVPSKTLPYASVEELATNDAELEVEVELLEPELLELEVDAVAVSFSFPGDVGSATAAADALLLSSGHPVKIKSAVSVISLVNINSPVAVLLIS